MSIEIDEVRRLASLARLDLPDQFLEQLTDDIGRILAHVEQLEDVDVSGVAPTAHGVEGQGPARADVPGQHGGDDVLRGVPSRMGDAVSVPRIIE